ncbi:hypothetical protein A1O1_08170 [Capronia coronata CBS 617.96]|uniref:Survival Motor Neuron Gemin2-binding domain-containing protein n=1 Tax=Capronia coronata CBS 617.96 TaxID=1182541 RepID=W9XYP6_9EURO|nr:uncharacterized protein A1O1_08170 [Capronia coronata CBS 617.96]EXJ82101.1 hypothetical protein A1O1_08170 [Capronia coronata CBS 617.96]
MPKNKKAKTKHYFSKNSSELSQAEIWDDSALIRSWNDAVAEYEFYHSIHARGEDVEEILRKAEMDELAEAGGPVDAESTNGQDDETTNATKNMKHTKAQPEAVTEEEPNEDAEIEDGEIDDDDHDLHLDLQTAKEALTRQVQGAAVEPEPSPSDLLADTRNETTENQTPLPTSASQPPPSSSMNNHPMIGPSLPPASVQGPSPDQTLENIKMAYYWAGYYSGLYDGQRQGQGQGQTTPSQTDQPQPQQPGQ